MNRVASKLGFVLAVALSAATAGCSGFKDAFDTQSEAGFFSKPMNLFTKPEWASTAVDSKTVSLGPKGPVAPDDLVGADGRCAPPVAEAPPQAPAQPAAAASPPADRPVGTVAGDLASAPMPAATSSSAAVPPGLDPAGPPVLGGIALGMTECDAVRRAGLPSNVSIGADDKGERKVVLTYLGGTWPGIYNFSAGRLKEVSMAPVQPKPAKPPAKKKPTKPKTAATQER